MICESCKREIHNCIGVGCGCQHRPRLRMSDINPLPQPEIVQAVEKPEEVEQ
jgi:hypothetical protein